MRLACLAVLVLAACSSTSTPSSGGGSGGSAIVVPVAPPAPATPPTAVAPPAPKFAVRDDQAKQLLLAAAAIPEDEVLNDNPKPEHLDARNNFAVYTNGTNEHPSPPIVETCASFLIDADPRIRVLAARCVGNGADRALKAPSPLRAPVIEVLLTGIEREANARVRRGFAEAFGKVAHAKELTPEPGLPSAAVDRLIALLPKLGGDPELQSRVYQATFTPTYSGDRSHLSPAVETYTFAQLAKDTPNAMTSAAFDALARVEDQAKVCKAIAPLLRADAKTADSAIAYVANRSCDDLVDSAIDLAVARGADASEALAVLDTFEQLRILPPATRTRIATALKAERAKAKDKTMLDHYVQVFSHKRNVPCADGIPC